PHIVSPSCGGVGVGCNSACATGFDDCNSNRSVAGGGCETPTNQPQTTGPTVTVNGVTFNHVATITNCGACNQNCHDSISNPTRAACTTDLCISVSGTGPCRHFDRAQCAGAVCTPAETPDGGIQGSESSCRKTAVEADGDRIPDDWETSQLNQ